eukprot:GEMP01010346.1.p1 GENE.GEMP01010346.1~~GEMP01010346.1.p1  ORF type:complete len:778 (+),score=129.85 GEMP01010346.1:85-2418(+)
MKLNAQVCGRNSLQKQNNRSSVPHPHDPSDNNRAASSSTSPASTNGPVSSLDGLDAPNMATTDETKQVLPNAASSLKGNDVCVDVDSEHSHMKQDTTLASQQEDRNGHADNNAHASAKKQNCVRWGVSEDAIEALRASIWWMCPRSFMSAICAGMRKLDEAVEIAYWRTVLSAECGVAPDLLEVSGPNTAQHWRRIFLDFETKPRRICSTEEEYARMFPSYDGDTSIIPKGIDFQANGTCLVDLGRHGDRCVVADARIPSGTSATLGAPDPKTGKYTVDYRRAHHYYYEVSAKLKASDDPIYAPRATFPRHRMDFCFSIGFASARIKPHRLARIQAGWFEHTWGLHSDDGNVFSGRGQSEQHFCESFGPGQVVGAGIMHAKNGSSRCLFFTLDGVFLGLASEIALPPHGGLIPICGVDCRWELEFNFGEKPFVFDLERNFGEPDGGTRSSDDDAQAVGPWMDPAPGQHPNPILGQVANLIRGHPLDHVVEEPLNPTEAQPFSQKSDEVSMLVDAGVSDDEDGLQYGPVWPWHQPAAIRPAGIHFNPRQFMGTWITSASDSWIGNYVARTRILDDLLSNSEDEPDITDSEENDLFGDFEPELWTEASDEEYDEVSVESFVADSDEVSIASFLADSDTSDQNRVDPANDDNNSSGNSHATLDVSIDNAVLDSDHDVDGNSDNDHDHTDDDHADAISDISEDNILLDSDHNLLDNSGNNDENSDATSDISGDNILLDADHSLFGNSVNNSQTISDISGDNILGDSDHSLDGHCGDNDDRS